MTDDRMDKDLDNRFDELMRDAARTYRRPPEAPLDEMWAGIEAQLPGARPVLSATPAAPARSRFHVPRWAAIAATLVVGIGIGRGTTALNRAPAPRTVVSSSSATVTSAGR